MRLKIKGWLYKSISVLVALLIVGNSLTFDRVASALTPPIVDRDKGKPLTIANGNICPADLDSALNSIVGDATFDGAHWGVLVQSLTAGQTLYHHNEDELLIPASNIKLLTTAAAVQNVPKLQPLDIEAWLQSIGLANRDSNNSRADWLLNRVGGVTAISNAIAPLGVNTSTYQQVDGSGLSRSNRAEAATFVNLLKGMYTSRDSKIFYDSLSIAGVNGTLRNRLKDPIVRGRLHAKTGTLTGVRSLSGYLENPNYGPIVFSIMVNQSRQSGQVMVKAIDRIVLELAQLKNCA